MRKIKVEKIIRKFKELSEEEQDKIIEEEIDLELESTDMWSYDTIIHFIYEVKEKTDIEIEENNIIWSVGNRYGILGIFSSVISNYFELKYEDKGVYDIDIPNKIGSHTEMGLAKVYFDNEYNATEEKKKEIIAEINEKIDIIIELCVKYYKRLENNYQEMISYDNKRKFLEEVNYEYDEELKLIN